MSDDLEYVEKRVLVNLETYNFQYIYHEITGLFALVALVWSCQLVLSGSEKGFMTVTPWKLRSMGLNENRLNAGQLREGARVSIRNFDTVTEYTKAPDYLQVPLLLRYNNVVKSTTMMSNLLINVSSLHRRAS